MCHYWSAAQKQLFSSDVHSSQRQMCHSDLRNMSFSNWHFIFWEITWIVFPWNEIGFRVKSIIAAHCSGELIVPRNWTQQKWTQKNEKKLNGKANYGLFIVRLNHCWYLTRTFPWFHSAAFNIEELSIKVIIVRFFVFHYRPVVRDHLTINLKNENKILITWWRQEGWSVFTCALAGGLHWLRPTTDKSELQ